MSEVKGQCHVVQPVCDRCTSFSFHNQSDQPFPEIRPKACLTLKNKTHPNFQKKIRQRIFQDNFSTFYSGNKNNRWNKATMFCSDWISDSQFFVQTFFLLISQLLPWVWHKWFWCERQRSWWWWRRTRRRKRTENIESPQIRET